MKIDPQCLQRDCVASKSLAKLPSDMTALDLCLLVSFSFSVTRLPQLVHFSFMKRLAMEKIGLEGGIVEDFLNRISGTFFDLYEYLG